MKNKNHDAFDNKIIVPFFSPWITKKDTASVVRTLQQTLLTDGPQLRQFELLFSKFTNAKYCVGVSNATSALHLSLKALGIGKGDEVIVPNMTFVATANAVVLCGGTPVFADVNLNDMNISVDSIKENITAKTKLILPVHFAGKTCDIITIKKIARDNQLSLIEDCAHAIGTKYDNTHVGNFGDAGCFSFYPTKNITTIEGGMVVTNSKEIAKFVSSARNHGITKSLSQRYTHGKPWEYDIIESGYNYRLDEVRSSLGISQIQRINELNKLREKAFRYYNSRLGSIKGIFVPEISECNDNAYHLYIIRITEDFRITRDKLFKKLLQKGIRTSVHYRPLHQFTAFKKFKKNQNLQNSVFLYKEILSLPFYPNISKRLQDYVINSIIDASNR